MRATLRAAAVARLLDADTSAGTRVYASRTLPQEADDLRGVGPAIVVWVTREAHQHIGQSPIYQTQCTISVQAWASAADDEALDEVCDTLVDEIQAAIMTTTWPAEVDRVSSITVSTEIGQRANSRELVGRVDIEFIAEYRTEFLRADDWSDFTRVDAETDIPPADGDTDISWTEEAA